MIVSAEGALRYDRTLQDLIHLLVPRVLQVETKLENDFNSTLRRVSLEGGVWHSRKNCLWQQSEFTDPLLRLRIVNQKSGADKVRSSTDESSLISIWISVPARVNKNAALRIDLSYPFKILREQVKKLSNRSRYFPLMQWFLSLLHPPRWERSKCRATAFGHSSHHFSWDFLIILVS